jgi:hypothetical protein
MSEEWKRRLISILFTLAVVAVIGLVMAPLPLWTPQLTPTPEPTATPKPTPTVVPDVTVCSTGCDFTTIREAIGYARDGDAIAVLDGIHTEQGITVNRDVIIVGEAADGTIVQGHSEPDQATESVFVIAEGATVSLRDLTIRHGNPESGTESGGAVSNRGTVTLERCLITENVASAGGGLHNYGSMTLINTTVSNNIADGTGAGYTGCGTGGGIKVENGPLVVVNSTISGNRSLGNGGGIFLGCKGTIELITSTISGNDATGGSGGGICIRGAASITASTIVNNRAAQTGGGIYVRGSGESGLVRGWLDYSSTIVAGNTTGSPYCCADCMLGEYSTLGISANNLVEDGSCSPALSGDPLLGPLGVNGGDTRTHALLPESPAIDALSAVSCTLTLDQRGLVRPVELRSSDTPCDVGAYEVQQAEE